MSNVIIPKHFSKQLEAIDKSVKQLNEQKIVLIFEILGITKSAEDLEMIMDWDMIYVTVLDSKMAMQLNKLMKYVPNIRFVVDNDKEAFAPFPGVKGRRIRKDR